MDAGDWTLASPFAALLTGDVVGIGRPRGRQVHVAVPGAAVVVHPHRPLGCGAEHDEDVPGEAGRVDEAVTPLTLVSRSGEVELPFLRSRNTWRSAVRAPLDSETEWWRHAPWRGSQRGQTVRRIHKDRGFLAERYRGRGARKAHVFTNGPLRADWTEVHLGILS